MKMPTSTQRIAAAIAALGCVSLLSTACNNDKNNSEPDTVGGADVVADADGGGMDGGGDGGGDVDPSDTGETADGTTEDTGTVDTGPPGTEVQAGTLGVFPPVPASCDEPGERQRIPFYISRKERTRSGRLPPIRAGDLMNGQVIEPDGLVGPGMMTTRRARVTQASQTTCGSSDQCMSPLKCGEAGVRGADRYCARTTGVEFIPGTTRQDVDPNFSEDSGQVVAIALENTGSYEGELPSIVGTKYDENGEDDFSEDPARATDPELKNRKAIETFGTYLATAADSANTKVSLWFFGGQTPSTAQPKLRATETEDHFTDDLELVGELVNDLPSPPGKPANVYQTINRVVDRDLGIDKYEDHEKFLFLVTDGPNEVWSDEATKQKVLEKLEKHDVQLYILHLDKKIDGSLLRDVPTYWAGNDQCRDDDSCDGASPCGTDADCANFETCRKATIYADEEGGQVEETGVSYCMPDYSDGYLGPIGPYADLACQTGGNYIYTTEPEQLVHWASRLPYAIDGRWSIEAEVSALDPKVGLPDGFYRLSGVFLGLLAPNMSSTMSAVSSSGVNTHSADNRGLLRVNRGE